MSEFDKEAEREKLREQYAADEQDREETERMSDLLLGGATMTNKHCENCGNPLFRQNGRTFCSNCGDDFQAVAESPADAGTAAGGGEQTAEVQPTSGAGGSTDSREEVAQAADPTSASNPSVSTPRPSGDGDFAEARASLVRTLTAFSRRAEAAENPSQARALLSTAREAAETLDAVDRIGANR